MVKKMKIVGVIPARYDSTRLPGKPLSDICGKPMIWWVYKQMEQVEELDEIYVAVDDERVAKICEVYDIKTIMTSKNHSTHLDRLSEVAAKIEADFYININGDEPLINPEDIRKLLPNKNVDSNSFYVANAMMILSNPVDVADVSKIKITTDINGYGMYMARTPIPFPKGTSNFKYKKFVGIQCFTRAALIFCGETKRGEIEGIEDIDEYRFLENGRKIKFVMTNADTVAVDTAKDLDRVRKIINDKLSFGKEQE